MPNIDTSMIDGFDSMSADEKVSALLAFQYDDGAEKVKAAEDNAAKMKAAFDKAASEAAGYKKQLNATKSAEELAKQETADAIKAMEDKIAEYEKRERLSNAKTMFLGSGFDEQTSNDAAAAFIAGDNEKMSAALKKFREQIVTATKSSLMSSNPKMECGQNDDSGSDSGNTNIAEQLGKAREELAKKSQSTLDYYTRRGKNT